jgi:hypothetical protein
MGASPKNMIITGGVLLVLCVVVAALQVIQVLPLYLGLTFFAFICLISGMFIGMLGIFAYVKKSRDDRNHNNVRLKK